MKQYITVQSQDRTSFSTLVCEQIELGYVPLGGVAVASTAVTYSFGTEYLTTYTQALYKPSLKLLND